MKITIINHEHLNYVLRQMSSNSHYVIVQMKLEGGFLFGHYGDLNG